MHKKTIRSILTIENILYFLIIFLVFLKVMSVAPIYFPDSKGYLKMTIYRSFGYPLFLEAHKQLFGIYFEKSVILTQFVLNILSPLYLISCLKKTTSLNKWLALILYVIMLFPIFMGIFTVNTILSESLAYPLYFFVIGNLLLGIFSLNNRHFYYAFLLTFLLIAVRGQFLFIVPVLLVSVLLTFYKSLFHWKTILLFVSVLAIPVLAVVSDIAFHKIVHNQNTTTPLTGIQTIAIPFFVSEEDDYKIFKTKAQQDYFRHVYAKLKERKLLSSQLPDNGKKIEFFFDKYVDICNLTIGTNGLETFPASASETEKFILNDKITSAMTVPLLKHNFKKWFQIYIANFMKGFDTSKYFLLYLIIMALSIVLLYKKENMVSKVIIILCLLPITNVVLVAAVESTIGRYIFYNNWILFGIFFLLLQNKFYSQVNE